MTTKHTPGPWEAAYNGDPVCVGAVDADGFYRFVAMTLPAPEVSPDPTSEDYANAQLIAASPDMLAALKEFLSVFPGKNQTMNSEQHAAWQKACELVTKLEA